MYPRNAAKAIQRAHIVGLQSLVNLLRARVTVVTQWSYRKAHQRLHDALLAWRDSRTANSPDFSIIAREEKHLRDLELQNIWETTARYGNTERKRIKNETSEPVGPLNALLNMLGAILRNYFLIMYPFEQAAVLGRTGKRIIWGLPGGKKTGAIPVAHGPRLVELDFADMIRSHCREVARTSFIKDVPLTDFDNYILLLIRRLSPFSDYLYTDGDTGRWEFKRLRTQGGEQSGRPNADQILRGIVSELEAVYGMSTRGGSTTSPASQELDRSDGARFFDNQLLELRNPDTALSPDDAVRKLEWAAYLESLLRGKKPRLRSRDEQYLSDMIRNSARWRGIKYHGLVSDGYVQPYSVRSVVLDGSRFVDAREGFLTVSELPLDTQAGPGRADLCIFRRTTVLNPMRPGGVTVLKPVGVFDLKTRTAFNWHIKAKGTKKPPTAPLQKTVPDFILNARGLTEKEWEEVLCETPSASESKQLEQYARGLIDGYREATGDDSCEDLLKGIILVDSAFDIDLSREILPLLIEELRNRNTTQKTVPSSNRCCVRVAAPENLRIALILDGPTADQLKVFRSRDRLDDRLSAYDPFSDVEETKSRHIVYVSVGSGSTSGFTASRIAEYWHGMQLLKKLVEREERSKVVWLDLAGAFGHRPLAEKRLRLEQQDTATRMFFDSVEILDLSSCLNDYLFAGQALPDLESILSVKTEDNESLVIAVSGWEWIEDSTPPRLSVALRELERFLVEELNRHGSTVLWFCKARPAEETSWKYHKRAALPFWHSSPHGRHVTDIIWNLPIRPYTSTQTTPMLDDVRVIITLTSSSVDTELVEIPPLSGWSERFWSKRKSIRNGKRSGMRARGRIPLSASEIMQNTALREELIQDSVDLVPWLRILRPERFDNVRKDNLIQGALIQTTPLLGYPSKPSSVLSRTTFRTPLVSPGFGRLYMSKAEPLPIITHARRYRQNRLKSKTNAQAYSAPRAESLRAPSFSETRAGRAEIRLLKKTIQFLINGAPYLMADTAWENFVSKLSNLVPEKSADMDFMTLNRITDYLRSSDASRVVWESLSWVRERRLGDGLHMPEKRSLERLVQDRPHVPTLYGNYLTLILVAISSRYPGLSENQIADLWETVRSWQLLQLGFHSETQHKVLRPKFDVRAIWANLCKRAKTLSRMPQPVQSSIRFGLLLASFDNEQASFWLFIQDEHDPQSLIAGLWTRQNPLLARGSIAWSETNHDIIVTSAKSAKNADLYDVVAARVHGVDCIWLKEDEDWRLLGGAVLIHRPREAIVRIRGVRIESIEWEELQTPPKGLVFPSSLRNNVFRELEKISAGLEQIVPVRCSLTIDSDKYVVSFEANGKTVDEYRYSQTCDMLRLLRRPLVEGVPLRNSRRPEQCLTWDSYEDIEYNRLQLFRPYVERKTPYVRVESLLPLTCEELVKRPTRKLSLVISHDKRACPVAGGASSSHGACWRIRVVGDSLAVHSEWPPTECLTDRDIASLIASKEVFTEKARYRVSIEFNPDISTRKGIVFRESRMIASELGLMVIPPGTFLHVDKERLLYSLERDGNEIHIGLSSTVTGERVGSGTLTIPEGEWDVDTLVDALVIETEELVDSFFDKREGLEKRIVDYEKMLLELRKMLKQVARNRPS